MVFHLAADHGGRGYIDSHQVECSTNMILDGQVFEILAKWSGKNRFCFIWLRLSHISSNGCRKGSFPLRRHGYTSYEADDLYGWAKLMGELF